MLYIKSSQAEIDTLVTELVALMDDLKSKKKTVTTGSFSRERFGSEKPEANFKNQHWDCLIKVAKKNGNIELLKALKVVFKQALNDIVKERTINYLSLPGGPDLKKLIIGVGIE